MQAGQAPHGLSDPADTTGKRPRKDEYELVLLGQRLGHPQDAAILQTSASLSSFYYSNTFFLCLMRAMHSEV
jgi:hypothetical protein